MAIKKLDSVTCSLGLGYIYSCDYSFEPQQGISISLSFISTNGTFDTSFLNSTPDKCQIAIGSAYFNMYPVSYEIRTDAGRSVMDVKFVDDTFKLKNNYIVLKGQGCGVGVYEIGQPVDKRSTLQKIQQANDPVAQQIKDLTQFPDIEYSFTDLLAVIGQVFPIELTTSTPVNQGGNFYDTTFTRAYVGTFQEVLDNWCQYYGLSYFFENGTLKLFDPSSLQIQFPDKPAYALEYNVSESIENTFAKTAFAYFASEGGQKSLIPGSDDSTLTTYAVLNRLGDEFNLPQPTVDLNQCAAAQYGIEYWFLYNYFKGSAEAECGWKKKTASSINDAALGASVAAVAPGGGIASVDVDKLQGMFQFYKEYGQKIAGRYYLSNSRSSMVSDQSYTWYNQTVQVDFKITASSRPANIQFIKDEGAGYIDGTAINKYYLGVRTNGGRLLYVDNTPYDFERNFNLSDFQKLTASKGYQLLTEGFLGSAYIDYSSLGGALKYVVYNDLDSSIATTLNFGDLGNKLDPFTFKHTNYQIKGMKTEAVLKYQENQNAGNNPDDTTVGVITTAGPTVISTTSTIKVKNGTQYTLYYDKYSRCESSSSNGGFRRYFLPSRLSDDIPIIFSVAKQSNSIYRLDRDLTYLNQYYANGILALLAKSQNIKEKNVTFTLNYLYDQVPVSFLANGLVGLYMRFGDDGFRATYNYSNRMTFLPIPDFIIERLENQIRNSWIRHYDPTQTILG